MLSKKRNYSAIEHLSKTLLLSKWKGSVWAFMGIPGSAAYFDESGVDGSVQFPVVAGFLSDVNTWISVEKRLQEELRNKPKKLKNKKYMQQNHLLFAKIFNTYSLQPIHASIENSVFKLIIGKNEPFTKSYVACAYCCYSMVDKYAPRSTKTPIKMVFDRGSSYQHKLERAYKEYWTPKSRLQDHLNFENEDEVLPLLSGHLYAWLVSRERRNDNPDNEINKSLIAIHRTVPFRTWVPEIVIQDLYEKMIKPRNESNDN